MTPQTDREKGEWKQERPSWCPHKDCIFLRRVMDSACGGELPNPEPHGKDFNSNRFCMKEEQGVIDYQVNHSDLEWLRWIFDALDGKETSWLSMRNSKKWPD